MPRSLSRPDPTLGPLATLDIALNRLDRRRAAALVLASLLAVVTVASVHRSRSVVRALGSTMPVAVAARPLEPGRVLTADDVEWQAWPTGLAPPGQRGGELIGASVRWPVAGGDPILASALIADGGRLAADERAVTVPLPLAPPPVSPGDLVELVGVRPGFALGDLPTIDTIVLGPARVVAVDTTGITVAVAPENVIEVVETTILGSVEFVLTPSATADP